MSVETNQLYGQQRMRIMSVYSDVIDSCKVPISTLIAAMSMHLHCRPNRWVKLKAVFRTTQFISCSSFALCSFTGSPSEKHSCIPAHHTVGIPSVFLISNGKLQYFSTAVLFALS